MINVKNRIDLLKTINSQSKILDYLQSYEVIKTNFNCQKCRKNIKKYTTSNREKPIVMCTFRIYGKQQQSNRKDSVFFKVKAPLAKVLLIIYEWSQFTPLKIIKKNMGLE
ncbi:hypothetical protein CDIK_3119 [Cucumispora dikerogammari]|nr:hypothetical protein CDIK_3119 [Cucumispora dikerogammari]